MIYKIASFNVCNLSNNASKEKIDCIANIIKENQLDIVAMQEVLSEGKILTGMNIKSVEGAVKAYDRSLKSRLGNKWSICWRAPKAWAKDYVYEDNRGEGYAYIWNTDKFDLFEDDGGKIWPSIYRNYKCVEEGMTRLIREPCYGRFKVKGRIIELRLINAHIVYGKSKKISENSEWNNIGNSTFRNNEFKILAGQIYHKIAADHKKNTVPYTVMLGDYNLNLNNSGAGSPYVKDIICFDQYGRETGFNLAADRVINTVQDSLTTINSEANCLANNFDHFSYTNDVNRIIKSIDVLDVIQMMGIYDNKYKMYKDKVSDHLPIVMTIDI